MAVIHCANPSCAATVAVPESSADLARRGRTSRVLHRHRWRIQIQPGDDRAYAYCPRCKEASP